MKTETVNKQYKQRASCSLKENFHIKVVSSIIAHIMYFTAL